MTRASRVIFWGAILTLLGLGIVGLFFTAPIDGIG